MRSMGKLEVKDLLTPDEVITFERGVSNEVRIGGMTVARDVQQPGWTWVDHVRPIVGTETCQFHHRGLMLSGRMGVRSDEGEEMTIGPNQVFEIGPGHVAWVEGDEEVVTFDFGGGTGWASPPTERERIVATILFTDIVDSTGRAQALGDRAWRRALALHDDTVRTVLRNFRGREIETAGDSFLAIFDGAARAIRCAAALVAATAAIDVPIRAGIHTGEVELVDGHLRGVAVHAAARVMGLAGAGEVLVSSTTRELAEGSGLDFASRGRHQLRGLSGDRELFAVVANP
jgi:class 3 adenylate cyclase